MRLSSRMLAIAVSLVALPGIANAAPQLLGVVASDTPLKLNCADGICTADIPTFCLQAERETPAKGQVYTPNDADMFKVAARNDGGRTVLVPLPPAGFTSVRGYTTVRVAVPESAFTSQGLTPASVKVAVGGVLVPAAEVGDTNPIRDGEVAFAERDLQPKLTGIFERDLPNRDAIGVIVKLINQTPTHGRLARSERDTLWEDAVGGSPAQAVGVGQARAAGIYGACQYTVGKGRMFSLRRCLEYRLDTLMMDVNRDYWKAVQPGS